MAQHRALRRAGRAGRVDQDRQILGAGDLDHGIEGAGVLHVVAGAQVEQRLERHDLRILEPVKPVHVED